MNLKKLFARLFIFFIGLPLVLFIVCISYHNHIALHILICMVCAVASSELYDIFKTKSCMLPKLFIILCTVFIPTCTAIYEVLPTFTGKSLNIGTEVITYAMIISFLAILFTEVITAVQFESSNSRMAASLFIVVYAGYLPTFISRMTSFNYTKDLFHDISTPSIIIFLLMVFLCDSFAWLFGMLFGKNNRGFIKASPNKSAAGFAGGFVGSICAGLVGKDLFPWLFTGSVAKIIVLSICIAFAAIVGDLAESIFKRSAGIKDSGKIIPGRGGVLDSIDSILVAAPIYYFLFSILY